jgi:superfamily II DNA or RNA helicase
MSAVLSDELAGHALAVHRALVCVAGTDQDRAREVNGVGFSKFDGDAGHSLVKSDPSSWSESRLRRAAGLARKYRAQVSCPSADWVLENVPETVTKLVGFSGGRFTAAFAGDRPTWEDCKAAVKTAGFRWDPEREEWHSGNPTALFNLGWNLDDTARARITADPVQLQGIFDQEHPMPGTTSGSGYVAPTGLLSWAGPSHRQVKCVVPFALKDALKAFCVTNRHRATWEQNERCWMVPGALAEKLVGWADHNSVPVDDDLRASCVIATAEATAEHAWNLAMFNAVSSDLPFTTPGLSHKFALLPHQPVAIHWIEKNRQTILADDIGCGKTIMTLSACAATDAWPLLIVCPATLKSNWQEEVNQFYPMRTTQILEGRTGSVRDRDVTIVNYDILTDRAEQLIARLYGMVVFDEGQMLKNPKTLRTKAGRNVAKSVYQRGGRVVPATATPAMNRADEMGSLLALIGKLDVLGFEGKTGEAKFRRTYDGASHARLADLNRQLHANGLMMRRTKKEVLKDLPVMRPDRTVRLDVPEPDLVVYRKAEQQFITYIRERAAMIAEKSGEDVNGAVVQAEIKAAGAQVLMQLTALRSEAALAKHATVETWVEQFLETGKKLVLFGIHRSTTERLAARFNAPMIIGGVSERDRTAARKRFQTDPSCNLIVCAIAAAGFGLTLTAASDVALVELPWNGAAVDQAAGRIHRIGQTLECQTHFLLIPDTIDERMSAVIATKRSLVSALTDGELSEDDEDAISVAGAVAASYLTLQRT